MAHFYQDPPRLPDPFETDSLLREYLERTLPIDVRTELEPAHRAVAALADEYYQLSLLDRENEPVHTQWDAWGHRVDRIEVSPLWKRAQALAAEHGLVAAGYDASLGAHARVHQHVLNYLIQSSLDFYSCPLAMTDGAARTLLSTGNHTLIDHAVTRLTSRDPSKMWTSGQWMTERIGGSDVGQSETVAKQDDNGGWQLHGTKWFTSASTSEMALTLARPEGNPPGGRGLALFYVELRDEHGRLQNIEVNRLKDKFGTRKVPTAELTLSGTPAIAVSGTENGVRNITPMLNVTRAWNAVGAATGMRRAVALAVDYTKRRKVFGDLLKDKPLHVDTLAGVVAETQAAFLLAFRVVELQGAVEHGTATPRDILVARVLTPIAKLTTGKQAVAVASEAMESFGGAGYVEDTGLPRLLADAQVLPIWEGTTNVLSLDTLRALREDGAWEALVGDMQSKLENVQDRRLAECRTTVSGALDHAGRWLQRTLNDRPALEAGARRFAMTLGRATELALLAHHAQWCVAQGNGDRAVAAAQRFARQGVDGISDVDLQEESQLLV